MEKQIIERFEGNYAFLSNFWPAKVLYKGLLYHNSESAFQAQKVMADAERMQFTAMTPVEAKKYGRKVQLRPDWESVKLTIMRDIVLCKFVQNPDLKTALIATGDAELIEGNTWNDRYWGVCNGIGQNNLGKILMEIREQLKEDKTMTTTQEILIRTRTNICPNTNGYVTNAQIAEIVGMGKRAARADLIAALERKVAAETQVTDSTSTTATAVSISNNKEEETMEKITLEDAIAKLEDLAHRYNPFAHQIDSFTQMEEAERKNKKYKKEWNEILTQFEITAWIDNYANLGDDTHDAIVKLLKKEEEEMKTETPMVTADTANAALLAAINGSMVMESNMSPEEMDHEIDDPKTQNKEENIMATQTTVSTTEKEENIMTTQNPIINEILKEISGMNESALKSVLEMVKTAKTPKNVAPTNNGVQQILNNIGGQPQKTNNSGFVDAAHAEDKAFALMACIFKINPTLDGNGCTLVFTAPDNNKPVVSKYRLNRYLIDWAKYINNKLQANGLKFKYLINNIPQAQGFVDKLVALGYLEDNTTRSFVVNYENVDKAFSRAGEFVTKLMESH